MTAPRERRARAIWQDEVTGDMEAAPGKYRALDAPNGWGTFEHLAPALRRLLATFEAHPKATVWVSR